MWKVGGGGGTKEYGATKEYNKIQVGQYALVAYPFHDIPIMLLLAVGDILGN